MDYTQIQFEIQDKEIARIRFNRPDRMNAIGRTMFREFRDALQRVAKDNIIRVLIVSGNGRAWCVGGDLRQESGEGAHPYGFIESMEHEKPTIKIKEDLRSLRIPTIAQVNGYVMAEGYEFLTTFDLIVAAEGAKIGLYANRFGGPASELFGWLWMMPLRKVREMVYTGDLFDAEELYRVGFINNVVPLEKLEEETTKLAKKIANMNPLTMRLQKESMRTMLDIMGFSAAEKTGCLYHWIGHYGAENFDEGVHQKRLKLGMQWFARAARAGAFRDAETTRKVVEESSKEMERQNGKFSDFESLDKVIQESIESVKNDPNWKGPDIR
jgi:enoyl-CoA hydratase/carnithine racemase